MGKTLIGRYLARHEPRLVIIDPVGDKYLGLAGVVVDDINQLIAAMDKDYFRIVFRFARREDRHRWIFFNAIAVENVTLFLDEVSTWCDPHHMFNGMQEVIRMGRHRTVKLVCTTQRPADCHKFLFSEAEVYLGRFKEPNGLKYLETIFPEARKVLPFMADPTFTGSNISLEFVRLIHDTRPEKVVIPLSEI